MHGCMYMVACMGACAWLQAIRLEMAAQLSSTMDAVREAVHSKAARSQLEQVAAKP